MNEKPLTFSDILEKIEVPFFVPAVGTGKYYDMLKQIGENNWTYLHQYAIDKFDIDSNRFLMTRNNIKYFRGKSRFLPSEDTQIQEGKMIFQIWESQRIDSLGRILETLTKEYDPLWNYDRTETHTYEHGKEIHTTDIGERSDKASYGERKNTDILGKRTDTDTLGKRTNTDTIGARSENMDYGSTEVNTTVNNGAVSGSTNYGAVSITNTDSDKKSTQYSTAFDTGAETETGATILSGSSTASTGEHTDTTTSEAVTNTSKEVRNGHIDIKEVDSATDTHTSEAVTDTHTSDSVTDMHTSEAATDTHTSDAATDKSTITKDNDIESVRAFGNIGATRTQEMATDEINLRITFNFIDIMISEFLQDCALPYEERYIDYFRI